jgi:ADP-heptose:LPS heptosyltransferase
MINLFNPLERSLKHTKRTGGKRILMAWNRGLGDIPLGLYALVVRIRERIPEAEITFITRKDLKEGFALLKEISILVDPEWRRGVPFDLDHALQKLQLSRNAFDLIIESPDPTRWAKWQLGKLTPRLQWNTAWDSLHQSLHSKGSLVGVHVHSETTYGYEKNWPRHHWRELFLKLTRERGLNVLLFGFQPDSDFLMEGVTDLRGQTSLFEMLSIIKNRCSYLIVPDSGILSLIYYLDCCFPLQVISLWADPRQGILKQSVPSPNSLLQHTPLLGHNEEIATISVDQVIQAMHI